MNQKTQKREFPYVKLILIVTLVLVVAIVGYNIVSFIGIVSQLSTAGESKNFKANENIADVYRYTSGQQEFTYYYQYLSMYLSMYGSSSDINTVASIINNMDPMGGTFMAYAAAGKSSLEYVYDHIEAYNPQKRFDANAYATLRQVLTYCEGARAENLYDTYKEEVQSDLDDVIDDMKETAKMLGLSFSSFRKRYMGDGVSEKEVRKAMEMQMIAAKYSEKLNEEFMYGEGTTTADAEKYRDENKESFYISSYFSINLYEKALYDKVKECKDLDSVALAIANYYFDKNFEEQYKKYFGDTKNPVTDPNKDQTKKDILTTVLGMNALGDNKILFTATETDAYKKAARQVANGIQTSTSTNKTSLKTELEKVTKRADKTPTETAYVDLSKTPETGSSYSDLQKWLFKSERKTDDFEAILTTSTSSSSTTTTTTSYTLYIAKDIMKWDTAKNLEHTKDIFYIKLTDDPTEAGTGENETIPADPKTAAQKAQLMYDALKDIKDEDAFAEKLAELIEQYQPESSSSASIRNNVTESSLSDKNLKAWVYNPLRKPGDLAILPLSEEIKKQEDAAADAEKETSAETEAETKAETVAETKAETVAETEKETTAETAKPSTDTPAAETEKKEDIYLVYFVEENAATWEENARSSIASEKLNDWFENAMKEYNVSVDYEFETEAPATEAATKAETKAETEAETKAETKAA